MSYCVRWRRRWDSSSLPWDSSSAQRRLELLADQLRGSLARALGDVVVRGGPDRDVLELGGDQLAREWIELGQLLDLVAEQHRAVGGLGVRGEHLERFPLDAESAAPERLVVAVVLDRDELAQQGVAVDQLAAAQQLHVALVDFGRAEAVDAGHRRDDDHVAAREDRSGRRVAQPVDLRVDRGILLDVEVATRDVGLGLVVVVVGDEVLHRVLGEVGAELVAELRRERLVVGDHERGPLDRLDHARDRHRLARAGRTEQRREALAAGQALCDLGDRVRLVGGRREGRIEAERRHLPSISGRRCSRRAITVGRAAWRSSDGRSSSPPRPS